MFVLKSDHICLVETWMNPQKSNEPVYEMPERSLEHASFGKGKGCAIFSVDTKRESCAPVKVIKVMYQMMSLSFGNFHFVLLYISSDGSLREFVVDLEGILKSDMKPIVSGDFNFDKNEKNLWTHTGSLTAKGKH